MKKRPDNLKIVLAGGGSGGPVAPLFAIAESLPAQVKAEFLVIGTKSGPEFRMAESKGFEFVSISAGKLRRYFSLQTLAAPFQSFAGFFKARKTLKKFKANLVIGAGSHVSVPVGYAAWSLGLKILIHQQDLQPSLTNILLAPIADKITVSFKESLKDFNAKLGLLTGTDDNPSNEKSIFTGNPVSPRFMEAFEKSLSNENWLIKTKEYFGVKNDRPVLFITGGGTGSIGLNAVILDALPELVHRFEIIHSTGRGKTFKFSNENYHQFEFIDKMPEALAIADIIISRAGLNAITELCAVGKPAIIVPMPDSHQEKNALYLHSKHAALIYAQELLTAPRLVSILTELLYDTQMKTDLSENISKLMPKDSAQKIWQIILELWQ